MEKRLIPYEAVTKIDGNRVLVLAPHPDDEVFGCGGAIMRHVVDESALQVIILSDGAFRVDDAQQEAYAELRRQESVQAAQILGYGEPNFWGLPDRGIEYGEFLVQRIENAIETFQADLIYAPSIYEMHPDHRAAGMAAVEALRRSKTKLTLAMYEVGVPIPSPTVLLDISQHQQRKQQAMACFVSQLKEQSYDEHIAALNTFRTYTLGSQVTAAEAYLLTRTNDLQVGFFKFYQSEHQRQQQLGIPMMPADLPLVSVLIRSMDRPTLENALNSVALQTYPHIEAVVVNAKGGEHTALGKWCGRFPLRFVSSSEGYQRSRAANAAIKEANGRYLIFLDDDDWFAPHHISALVKRISGEIGVQAVYANIRVTGAMGDFKDHVFREEFDPVRMMADNLIPIHSVLFDQALIKAGCFFDETLSVYEDWDFWLQVSRHTSFSHVDEVGAYYCASGSSEVGLQSLDSARKQARELIFEKWKAVWSGAEMNALLAHKDALWIAKTIELDSTIETLKAELKVTVESLQAKSESTVQAIQTQSDLTVQAIQAQSELTVQAIQAQSDLTVQEIEAHSDSAIVALEEKLNSTVPMLEAQIRTQDEALYAQTRLAESLNMSLMESDVKAAELKKHIDALTSSTSWRLTGPFRWMVTRFRSAKHIFELSRQSASNSGGGIKGTYRLGKKIFTTTIQHGPSGLADNIRSHARRMSDIEVRALNSGSKDEEVHPSNFERHLPSDNALNSTGIPIKRRSLHTLKKLFHGLPVSSKLKYEIQDFCYREFPTLFSGIPSYKFWLARNAKTTSYFPDTNSSKVMSKDWSRMLPVQIKKISDQRIPEGEIDIVIPVYRGLAQTRRCIESVLNSTAATPFRLIIINDASPEVEVAEYLQGLTNILGVIVMENAGNLGFTATVNRGMGLSSANDVVLLNSDTEVSNNWLDKLRAHAYYTEKIGTVTPFSSNATICNYPTLEGMKQLPDGETTQSFDAAFALANNGRNIEIPTAVGFCMYIRRNCLTEVGLFDVETFGKGYGEENDFCLRASAMGWKHLLAADTFVFHEGEVSFQASSNPGKERAMGILRGRYPYYETLVAEHVTLNEAYPLRVAATAARFKSSPLPVILHILHGHGGGTEKHVEELCRSYMGKAKLLIMNAPLEFADDSDLRIRSVVPSDGLDLVLPASNVDFVALLCKSFGISLVHVHHVLNFPFDLKVLINSLGVPFYLTVHDYFLICPRINLMPLGQTYCGEPTPDKCNQCLSPDAPHGGVDIIWWRAHHAWLFEDASVVICPTRDVALRCKRYFPNASYKVVSHEKIGSQIFDIAQAPPLNQAEPLRVAILGVLARHKGMALISDALQIAETATSRLEFRLIGFAEDVMPNVSSTVFTETGHYDDAELPKLIQDFDPHLILFPACWPETYSYTLTVALNSGRPIMATEIGAFSERLSARPWTWLIDWNISAGKLVRLLEKIRTNNFQTGLPPVPPQADLALKSGFVADDDFYQNGYLPTKNELRKVPSLADIRVAGKITAMVLLEYSGSQPGPCAYIRLILPLVREHGARLQLRWVTSEDFSHYRSDVLIVQRTAVTSISTTDEIVAHCRKNDIRIVYDLDDFLLALPADHPEHAVYAPRSAAVRRWLTQADEVWVSTEPLRVRVAEINARARVVPNYLDEQLWEKPMLDSGSSSSDGPVRLLYMGTQTHLADFEVVKSALHRIKNEFQNGIEVCLIGISATASDDKWYKTLVAPQTVGSNYPAFVNWLVNGQQFDIGITPLVDNEFNRCKSAIKFLDYSALGMVTVASDIGVYLPIRDGENGFLVENSEDAWYRTLKQLMTDSLLRSRIKRVARNEVFNSHGFESVRGLRLRLLTALLSDLRMESQMRRPPADRPLLAKSV